MVTKTHVKQDPSFAKKLEISKQYVIADTARLQKRKKEEWENELKNAEIEINRAILNIEKAKYAKSEQDRYNAIIDALRAFQGYRLCLSRTMALHAGIYGASGESLFNFSEQDQDNEEWNQNTETAFDAASLSYGPLLLLDLFTEAKTKLQKYRKFHRKVDAFFWFILNIIRLGDNNYDSDQMTNLLAGTLILGYAIDLLNQLYLDTRELNLVQSKIDDISKCFYIAYYTKNNKNEIIIKYNFNEKNAITAFAQLELDEELIPADQLKIYKLLKQRVANSTKCTNNEITILQKNIEQNINQINKALSFQRFVIRHRLECNKAYAGFLILGSILLWNPAGMSIIVGATVLNQINAVYVNWLNYAEKIKNYTAQEGFLSSIEIKSYTDDEISALNNQLISHNLRPIEPGENLEYYVYGQKLNIKTNISNASRMFKLNSSWHVMNIVGMVILLTCPIANVGFVMSLAMFAFYVGAKQYCAYKNNNEAKETELYTKAVCLMSKENNQAQSMGDSYVTPLNAAKL